jgi:hypothetical protein
MASSRQRDLFQDDGQTELFDGQPTPEYRPDSDSVRAELHKILAEARAAKKLPWEPTRVTFYRTIFPQMTNPRTKALSYASRDRNGTAGGGLIRKSQGK